jgi:CheY-like chemotaxis protein
VQFANPLSVLHFTPASIWSCMIAIPDPQHRLVPLKFRFALVIEEADYMRISLVNVLKARGWYVHGIRRAEQAVHILAHIPYGLIVIDSELPGLCAIDFVRILHDSGEWREIQLVVVTSSQDVAFTNQIAEHGAFLARKSRWQDDLFSFLSAKDEYPTENSVSDQRV